MNTLLWVSVLIESYRRAMVGGTPEFPGQLIASLLVAQWSVRWSTSLVAQGSIPGMSCSESAIKRGKTQNDAAATCLIFVNYILLFSQKELCLDSEIFTRL
jgi:hypothetical protein